MKYQRMAPGIFLDRPNRFIAHVQIDGKEETVHVKNTGRCRELLLPGAQVMLQLSDNPNRKTAWDLISVKKEGLGWVNMDSQAPNRVVREFLEKQPGITYIRPEYRYGDSRVDFYFERFCGKREGPGRRTADKRRARGTTAMPHGGQGSYPGAGWNCVFPRRPHGAGREAHSGTAAGSGGGVRQLPGLCDSDGGDHRGAAK